MSTALLIDTTSIQRYVFGSNKLKENIGASYIIDWVLSKDFFKLLGLADKDIGYCGGGNALLFFNSNTDAQSFAKKYSLKLLSDFPGVNPAFAIGEINNDFKKDKNNLFKVLNVNKGKFISLTVPLSHGFTADCTHSGYSMNVWENGENEYVSSVIKSKINFSEKANDIVQEFIPTEFKSKYCFTDNHEKLGSSENVNSHIAVVFADGNSIGERFKNTATLIEIQELSTKVNGATSKAFQNLIIRIINEIKEIEKTVTLSKDGNKIILPIRPIFIGGDDIVFVCDGRLGIYFAQIFLEEFEKQDNSFSACAGVSIVGKKFPFFRAHHLAEELCKNAKEVRNGKADNGSWLDFHISYGGYSGSLKEIRSKQFKNDTNTLLMRPYKLYKENTKENNFYYYIRNTMKLYEKNKVTHKQEIPNSKLKELREVLTKGDDSIKLFIKETNARGIKLPKINSINYHLNIFENQKTPYFDMLEIFEFYPEYVFERSGK